MRGLYIKFFKWKLNRYNNRRSDITMEQMDVDTRTYKWYWLEAEEWKKKRDIFGLKQIIHELENTKRSVLYVIFRLYGKQNYNRSETK